MLSSFKERAAAAITSLRSKPRKTIMLVHHDDADGISSGAIIKAALEREGFKVKAFCLERFYPQVLEDLHKNNEIIFYVDIGSSHADLISSYNRSNSLVIILDHHNPSSATDPMVLDMNLELFGFRGETDFSSSTCCYLFAKELDGKNVDLSYLALVGSSEIPKGFVGINAKVLEEALENGIINRKGNSLVSTKFDVSVNHFFSVLQILGSTGYYRRGPELGIEVCLHGLGQDIRDIIDRLEADRKEANKKLLVELYKERLRESEHIQYFDSGDFFKGMGTKVLGTFCSFLSYQTKLIKKDKYIAGFMAVPKEIPDWGVLSEEFVKVSVRVPKDMRKEVEQNTLPSAVGLLNRVTASIGGVADGHDLAASCIFPVEQGRDFIERTEKVISEYVSK